MRKIKKKNAIYKIKSKEKKEFPWLAVILSVLVVFDIAGIFLGIHLSNRLKEETSAEMMEETEEDVLNKYVGPADHVDRGEWVDPSTYYGVYTSDGVFNQAPASAMFSDEKLGIVPVGFKLEAAFLSYEDFTPYDSMTDYAYVSSYLCDANPEVIEMELGVDVEKMQIQGSYSTKKETDTYSGKISLDLSNISYYIRNIFDSENLSVGTGEGDQGKGFYGYLEPNFNLAYSGSFESSISGAKNGTISSQFSGELTQEMWSFTQNLSGQGRETFTQGEVYIRCKIPCICEKKEDGVETSYDSYVNLYLKISECKIGTRIDAMPEWVLEEN